MAGSAEAAIRREKREVADTMAGILSRGLPDYTTASAFRFHLDPLADPDDPTSRQRSATRDIADVSAVAQSLPGDVVVAAVAEQDVYPPEGDEPGNLQNPGEAVTQYRPPSDSAPRPSTEALLAVPTTVAARERAEQGSRALTKGWYAEAEKLFLSGARLAPADPLCWFGAGLATVRLDRIRAAKYLVRASRYLAADDPAGSVYVAIAASALLESQPSTKGAAADHLRTHAEAIDERCPALSLHLARLDVDRDRHLAEALRHDPLLAADVRALGLPPPLDRFEAVESHLEAFDDFIAKLQTDDDQPTSGASPHVRSWRPVGNEDLPLVRLERDLWRRVGDYEQALTKADERVEAQAAVRRVSEQKLREVRTAASLDLTNEITLPFFGRCIGTACFIIMLHFIGRSAAANTPSVFNPVIALLVLIGILAAIGYIVRIFVSSCWPYRDFVGARAAETFVPVYEQEVVGELNKEFALRLRRAEVKGAAEFRITILRKERSSVVPRRPIFTAGDLPLVPARA